MNTGPRNLRGYFNGGNTMKYAPPKIIKSYIEDEKNVPTVANKRSLWYHITEEERDALVEYIATLDRIPATEFEAMQENEKWRLSCAINDAERIVRNCIIK